MPVVLAVSDEVDRGRSEAAIARTRPDLVVSCGDLPFDHLEHLRSLVGAPLLYVLGNHDPPLALGAPTPEGGPVGCISVEGRITEAAGIRVAGLGGSIRYRPGPNQYTQDEMRERVDDLEQQCAALPRRAGGPVIDLLLAHSPPFGLGDADDPPHHGFEAFAGLLDRLEPTVLAHGHIHPYGLRQPDRTRGRTRIVNVIPRRLLEVDPHDR